MASSILACLFLMFFLPCFSNSCTTTLPCKPSIQIKPPFNFQSDITMGLNCDGYLTILCDNNKPFLLLQPKPLQLESISYDNNTITTQDPYLSSFLKESGCGNLYFDFSTADNEFYNLMDGLSNSLSSVRCYPPNLIQSPPKIFETDYSLSYSPSLDEGDKPPQNCLRPNNSVESFEYMFSFESSGELSLLSASYSSDLVAQPGCFANCTEVKGKTGMTKQETRVILILTATTVLVSVVFLGAFLSFYLKLRSSKNSAKNSAECISQSKDRLEGNIEMLLEKYGSFGPKRYNYDEVKKITGLFQHRLGKGGFGTVYRGILQDGRLVAVKILHNLSYGREELLNEILSIGRTSHVNVVSLLGFCIEGSKHALIYEYMPNGSLDNYIYSENPKAVLGWDKLYEIAIGIARGLEYLHRGCNTRIVHFDIKPHNILLDEDFNPKIADFGLAKLCRPKESIISMAGMRGTIGYIAPEVFSRSFGVVSTKSDVYSYGMMVLEMVGGRRNAKPSAENPSQVYFPHWLFNCLVEGSPIKLQACDVLSMEIEEIAKKMGMVGLWCTQTMPANRPSMNRVVEMLEKSIDELEMPPKPYLCSPPHSTILSYTSHTSKFGLNSQSHSDCLIVATTL